MHKTVRKALVATLPVLTGYLVLGFGFGILISVNGYGFWHALAMSGLIYAGSMQYAAIGLFTGGASLVTVALTTLMVNARHLFYGISMIERYKNTGAKKPYMIFALTDETYSLVCRDVPNVEENAQKRYCFWVSLFDQLYWIAGSLLGVAIGSVVHFNSTGIDFALTALFVTVFLEQWLSSKKHMPALCGVGFSVLCLLVFGADRFLIPAMLLIALFLCCLKEVPEDE